MVERLPARIESGDSESKPLTPVNRILHMGSEQTFVVGQEVRLVNNDPTDPLWGPYTEWTIDKIHNRFGASFYTLRRGPATIRMTHDKLLFRMSNPAPANMPDHINLAWKKA